MISAGDVWVADIPYTNQKASKKRPLLVLWLDAADVVVAAVTTAAPRCQRRAFEGLARIRAPSTVRLSRLDCLEQRFLVHQLGGISPQDAQRVKTAWTQHVNPRF